MSGVLVCDLLGETDLCLSCFSGVCVLLGVSRALLAPALVTTGDRSALVTGLTGNWKWVVCPGVPAGCGLRVAMGLNELQKWTGMSGVLCAGPG